jgi:lactoylglutathione lyase
MELGAFSISLAVKDIEASRKVYEPFGFKTFGGDAAQKLPPFIDVRELQRRLKAQGVPLQVEANESTTGPASFIAVDPDGNPILVDQHV